MKKEAKQNAEAPKPLTMRMTKWRLAWGVIIPMSMLCAYLAGYFMNNTLECMVGCAMQRAMLIQTAAQCNDIRQPPMSVAPNQSN